MMKAIHVGEEIDGFHIQTSDKMAEKNKWIETTNFSGGKAWQVIASSAIFLWHRKTTTNLNAFEPDLRLAKDGKKENQNKSLSIYVACDLPLKLVLR